MVRQKKEREFLTEDEIKALLRCPDKRTPEGKRDYALLLALLETGLRKAEICSLKVGDIKEYRNQKVIDVLGKGKRHRRIALSNGVQEAIGLYLKASGNHLEPNSPIFFTLGKHGPHKQRGLTRCAVDCVVSKYAKMALIKKRISPHTLRHSFAVSLLDRGVDLRTVQDLMGHSSIRTTEQYLHTNDDKKINAINSLNFAG